MKKFTLYTTFFLGSFILIFFLSACSIPEYTQSEIASLYQKQFQSTTTSLQDVFATLPEHYQSITQLQLTLPTDAIQGNVTYQSIKNIQDTAEKSTISLNGNLKDLKNNLPLQFSGAFLMFYTGKQMYFSIQDFFLFMGSGNAEAKFITLFAQQLAHKRIALDQQDTIRVDIIEIPTYREILEHFLNLYTPLTPTFTQVPDIKNTFEGKISTLSPAYLTSLKTVIQLISDGTRLGISTENISLQSDKESSAQYGVSEKKKAEYFSTLFLTTDTHTFTFVVGYSKGVFILGLGEIKRHNDADELSTQSLNLTFTPKNSTTYVIKALRQQNTQSLRSLDTTFKIKPESTSKLYLDFEGDMTLQPLQLINQPSLSLHFKGGERIQPPIETDFSLSGTVLLLSTLLE